MDNSTQITKVCKKCKQEQLLSEYWKSTSGCKFGVRSWCKNCERLYNKEWEKNNKPIRNKIAAKIRKSPYGKWKSLEGNCRNSKGRIKNFLTESQFFDIIKEPCIYCGFSENLSGIDRINSDGNYTLDNVVPCCSICNRMKMDHTQEFWYEHMKKILNHLGKL